MGILIMLRKVLIFAISTALVTLSSCDGKDPVYTPGSSSQGNGNQQGGDTPSEGKPDYSKLTAANHPRMIMDDEELSSLKERLDAGMDEILVSLHKTAIWKANSFLGGSEIVYKLDVSGRRILSQAKDCTSRLMHLSYAYRMTGDQKYLDEVEKVLGWVTAFPDWNAKNHFLDPAEMAGGVAICYDWLYPVLKEETKTKIEKCFKNFLFYPAKNKIWNLNFYETEDNWNTSCNGGIISAALAIYEKDATECKEMIEKSVASVPKCMNYSFNPDGAYEEGYSYLSDVLSKIPVLIITPLKDCLGYDYGISATPGWQKASECFLFLEGTTGSQFSYSDADNYLRPCYGMWYFAYDFKDPSVLFNELALIRKNNYAPSGENGRFLPLVLAYAAKMGTIDFSKITKPEKTMFFGRGIDEGEGVDLCMIRTLWDKSNNDKYLGAKGGKASSSHAHMDSGSFVYDAFGTRWSWDLGLQSYTSLENGLKALGGNLWTMTQESLRWKVLRLNNRYHSTLTINDTDQNVNGYGKITNTWNTEEDRGCEMNLTDVYGKNTNGCYRSFHLKGDILEIVDEVTAPKSGQAKVQWRMVTKCEATITKDYIKLKSGNNTLYLQVKSSGPSIEYTKWDPVSLDSRIAQYDASNAGVIVVGFKGTVTTGQTVKYTTTLTPIEPK